MRQDVFEKQFQDLPEPSQKDEGVDAAECYQSERQQAESERDHGQGPPVLIFEYIPNVSLLQEASKGYIDLDDQPDRAED